MVRNSWRRVEIPRSQKHKGILALPRLVQTIMKLLVGKTPGANAVLNPKPRYARKNQQPVIPSEVEESLDETLRHTVRSNQ
jgi:hypothetical protein